MATSKIEGGGYGKTFEVQGEVSKDLIQGLD